MLVVGGVFILDLVVPLGAAVYIPYLIAIVLSSKLPMRQATLITASICTVLAVLGMVLSLPGPPAWVVLTNRILIIAVIWVTALLVRQRQLLYDVLRAERDTLDWQIEVRTAELVQTNGQLQDEIAERQKAQDALQERRDLLRVTLTSIGDAVLATDTQGRVTFLNPVAQKLTGWQGSDALGSEHGAIFRTVHERTRQPLETPISQVLRHGTSVSTATHAVLLRRDGREVLIAESAAPIKDAQGILHGAVLIFRDTTREKQLEDELIRAQKLESVGVLAAGIAHDFNNLLAVVMGNLSLARRLALPEVGMAWLTQAQDACRRATTLTGQLLTFSKGGVPVRQPMTVSELIVEATQFATRGSHVRAVLDLEEALWTADVDAGQFHQVLHNVVLNAVQAMPEGGIVQVRAQNRQLAEEATLPLAAGRYIVITVQDHGGGIAVKDLPNIFDPYFTTKPEGDGLGLATADAIIRKHDGYIAVASEVGMGTTINIYLPASQETMPPVQRPCLSPPDLLVSGGGRILVLDDEESIREMLEAMLDNLGYDVTCVEDGVEAIARYREGLDESEPYAVVILDLTIPGGMGGQETVTHLREIDAEVKAIASSGYAHNPVMAYYARYGFQGILPKPYTTEMLSAALHRALMVPSDIAFL
jgi:PAS domain S-box-containing protein